MLTSVAESIACYASTCWVETLKYKVNKLQLFKTQRTLSMRICRSYHTVSLNSILLFTLTIQWVMKIEGKYKLKHKITLDNSLSFRDGSLDIWQLTWKDESIEIGRWTRKFIPDLRPWLNRKFREIDYYITQKLTGHGHFKEYLHKMDFITKYL